MAVMPGTGLTTHELTLHGHRVTYRVAGVPAHHGARTVSAGSPVGAALLGRAEGDMVAVELPGGRVEHLRVLSVSAADRAR